MEPRFSGICPSRDQPQSLVQRLRTIIPDISLQRCLSMFSLSFICFLISFLKRRTYFHRDVNLFFRRPNLSKFPCSPDKNPAHRKQNNEPNVAATPMPKLFPEKSELVAEPVLLAEL